MTIEQISEQWKCIKNLDIDFAALEKLLLRTKIDERKGCWFIKGRRKSKRQKIVTKHGRILVYRFTHWVFKHKIPDNLLGCHKCDTPGCFNPEHILAGTYSDNAPTKERRKKLKLPVSKELNLKKTGRFKWEKYYADGNSQ